MAVERASAGRRRFCARGDRCRAVLNQRKVPISCTSLVDLVQQILHLTCGLLWRVLERNVAQQLLYLTGGQAH